MENALNLYKSTETIWKTVPPVLIVIGTIGNILTIIVLARRQNRFTSTAMFLTALAMSDMLVLYTGLLRQWIIHQFEIDVRSFSRFSCKVHIFLVYFGTQLSSWLLVAVTSERFVCVLLPHKVKKGCTPGAAGSVICAIVGCLVLLNAHWIYGMGTISIDKNTTSFTCDSINNRYYNFLAYVWPWLDLCAFCVVPFIILLTGNISIILRVWYSKLRIRNRIAPFRNHTSTDRKKDRKASQLTAMLLTLNVFFFICVTPISVFLIGEPHWSAAIVTDYDTAKLLLWWAIVNMFMYLNSTMNFVLYVLSGSKFRNEVKALFRGRCYNGMSGDVTRVVPTSYSIPMENVQLVNTITSHSKANNFLTSEKN